MSPIVPDSAELPLINAQRQSLIELSLISHTNTGKTTLARTLLGRDIGEVRDAAHVTEFAEAYQLAATPEGDILRLWDTPGFGDSVRLVKRLRSADNPLGWFVREVWDRRRDRPFWCSQQAIRAARDNADVVLYLVNAAENPSDAGYVAPEMQILRWIGKPVIVLLNQIGPPRPHGEDRAEEDRWRTHLEPLGVVSDVLTLDAFARCWVQESVLLDAVNRHLPPAKRDAFSRLRGSWLARSLARFRQSVDSLAEQFIIAARDTEPVDVAEVSAAQKVLRSIASIGSSALARDRVDPARTKAMGALAARLDAEIKRSTDRMIALYDLDGSAAAVVLQRLRENFATKEQLDEGRAAIWGSIVTGALTGLKADLAAGGLTFGAGLVVGGVLGAVGGAGVARGYNRIRGVDRPVVSWQTQFLDGLVCSGLLRYLAIAHFGRGRGRYVEGEAPAFWRPIVEGAITHHADALHALWENAHEAPEPIILQEHMQAVLRSVLIDVLTRLYPDSVPPELAQEGPQHDPA